MKIYTQIQDIGYRILVLLVKAISRLPLWLLYIISDCLYPVVYYLVRYRKKVVFENLRNSFPEKSEKEITIIAQKFYHHFCDLIIEIVKLNHISANEITRRFKLRNPEKFNPEWKQKKHILFVLGHYNNWEWGCCFPMQIPKDYTFSAIYKPLTNKYFDNLFLKMRSRFGALPIPINKTGRTTAEFIRNKKLLMLNFIADQSPSQGDIKYWTTFLNQETPVYIGIENMARKIRQPVYFFRVIKIKRGYYEVEAEKLCDDCNDLEPNELTEMHVRILERQIQEAPQYWLWSHRRWKVKKDE
ncbi:MAG: lysophospholipid acyltransferase family protein [Bacteroidota bacterium]|nr:lysophospholipid acyltransferase family protein [Bacteroidota bacterium]